MNRNGVIISIFGSYRKNGQKRPKNRKNSGEIAKFGRGLLLPVVVCCCPGSAVDLPRLGLGLSVLTCGDSAADLGGGFQGGEKKRGLLLIFLQIPHYYFIKMK